MTMPLEGLTVLDLCRVLPGPFCTMVLGDMGAEVIKVEEMEDRGGVGRDMMTPPAPSPEEELKASAYNHLARNKKSVALNLRDDRARGVFYRLAGRADVVVESYRPGVAQRLKVDYTALSHLNPGLVYCSISGYGQDSIYGELPGHEPDYCSMAGAVALTGDREGNPVVLGITLADVGAALHAVIGILCALKAREKTGRGQYIDLSVVDCLLSFTGVNVGRYLRDGLVPQRGWITPFRAVWRTGDGKFVSATNPESHLWQRFCEAIGRQDLAPLQRSKQRREELVSEIEKTMLTRTREEWVSIFREKGVSAAPVLEINEVASDPHFLHRNMIVDLNHPTQGAVKQVGIPFKLSDTPGTVRSFAPLLGQHTDEVLEGLGYSVEQISDLKTAGAAR